MAIYKLSNDKRMDIREIKDDGPETIIRIGTKVYCIKIRGMQTEETTVKPETIERFRKIMERYRDTMERLAK